MKITSQIFISKLEEVYSSKKASKLYKQFSLLFNKDLEEDIDYLVKLFSNLLTKNNEFENKLEMYKRLIIDKNYIKNNIFSEFLSKESQKNKELINKFIYDLEKTKLLTIRTKKQLYEFEIAMASYKEMFKLISSKIASLFSGPDWRSPAYSGSLYGSIFDYRDIDPSICNYRRYGYPLITHLEKWYKEKIFGIKDNNMAALITSSGMSSYALIEDYLTKYVVKPNDLVMIAPYIYFENFEQLTKN